MVCNCCGQQREKLHVKESSLMKGNKLTLCSECLTGKHEPRYIVILVGISEGVSSVETHIKNHRYHGDEIFVREIVR